MNPFSLKNGFWESQPKVTPEKPAWVKNAVMLWKEDECLRHDPDAAHIGDEWERQFGCLLFDDPVIETFDDWDRDWKLHPGGRIEVRSFDGSEIWRESSLLPSNPDLSQGTE